MSCSPKKKKEKKDKITANKKVYNKKLIKTIPSLYSVLTNLATFHPVGRFLRQKISDFK